MTSFFDQYKTPQWQKRRLERLEASGWVCEACDADEQQLHVHHKRYVAGRKVWEYADNELSVLCESCHARHHEKADRLKKLLAQLDSAQIDMALGYMEAMVGTSLYFESCDATTDVSIRVESAEEAGGAADYLRLKEQSVIGLAMSGPVRMRDLWAMRKEKKQ